VIPNFQKRREIKDYSFFFVFSSGSCATGVWNFWKAFTSKTVEFLVRLMRWGRELWCERVGPWNSIRPTSPLTLAALPLIPSPLCNRPPLSSLCAGAPLSHLLLPQTLVATIPQTLAAPISSSPRCNPPTWSTSLGCKSPIGIWWNEEGGRKGGDVKVVDLRIVISTILNSRWRQVNTVVVATVWFASYALSLSMHKY
jgi:hypothetical protein